MLVAFCNDLAFHTRPTKENKKKENKQPASKEKQSKKIGPIIMAGVKYRSGRLPKDIEIAMHQEARENTARAVHLIKRYLESEDYPLEDRVEKAMLLHLKFMPLLIEQKSVNITLNPELVSKLIDLCNQNQKIRKDLLTVPIEVKAIEHEKPSDIRIDS